MKSSTGVEKKAGLGNRKKRGSSSSVLPFAQMPSLFRLQKKGAVDIMTCKVSFRSKMTEFLNEPLSGHSFSIVECPPSNSCLLKCSDSNVNPDWIGNGMVWLGQYYYTT